METVSVLALARNAKKPLGISLAANLVVTTMTPALANSSGPFPAGFGHGAVFPGSHNSGPSHSPFTQAGQSAHPTWAAVPQSGNNFDASTSSSITSALTANTLHLANPTPNVHNLGRTAAAAALSSLATSHYLHAQDTARIKVERLATDLSSPEQNIILTNSLFAGHGAVSIDVGSSVVSFNPGMKVTSAEYIAIKQVLTEGNQSIALAGNGTANGGTFNVTLVNSKTSELLIPQGVTAVDNLTLSPNFGILGNIFNYGSLIAVAGVDASSGIISGRSIVNERGASISTSSGSAAPGTLVDLTLTTINNLSNAGTIKTDGNLYLNVGNGQLLNTGLIQSSNAHINIAAPTGVAMTIDASAGTFSAINGNINIGRCGDANGSIYLTGGNYLSQALNLNAGSSGITADVDDVTGQLNTRGTSEHFSSASQTLVLGDNTIDGDPTFVNTAPGGTIVITGVNTFTEAVAILANGNITTAGGGQIVTNGADVTIIAGAKTETKGSIQTGIPGAKADQSVTVTLDPLKSSGGNIDFSANAAATVIDTSTKAGGKNAGNVILVGFANGAGVGGNVLLGTNSIDARSTGSGAVNQGHDGGDVSIYAGAITSKIADTITVGSIKTGAGQKADQFFTTPGKSGTITLMTKEIDSSNANHTLVFNTVGTITSGKIKADGPALINAGINASGNLDTTGDGGAIAPSNIPSKGVTAGAITIIAGGLVSTQDILAFGTGGGGGSFTMSNPQFVGYSGAQGGDGAPITITAGKTITVGQLNTSGGGGGGGSGQGGTSSGGKGADGGKAANITISSTNGQFITSTAIYAVDGGAGGRGGFDSGFKAAGGGGGGGSYGGGGGGGADIKSVGGGGGGGYFGGGGGEQLGGGGGSSTAGGAGGGGAATAGTSGSGGKGAGGTNGGGLGGGGLGGTGGGLSLPGFTGANATESKAIIKIDAGGTKGLTLTGGAFANTVSLSTSNGGTITTFGNINALTQLTISSSGDVISNATTTLISPVLNISSSNGSIGVIATPINIIGPSVAASAPQGDVYLSDTATKVATLTKANAKGVFSFITDGGIIFDKPALIATASPIQAASVILGVTAGGGVQATTETHALTVNADYATISNTGALTISGTSKTFKDFILKEKSGTAQFDTGMITLSNAIIASGKIDIEIANVAGHAGGIVGGAGVLNGASISIENQTNGSIGSSATPAETVTSLLQVKSLGDVFLANTGAVTIQNSTAGAGNGGSNGTTFSLSSTSGIAIGAGGIKDTPNKSGVGTISLASNGGITLGAGGGELVAHTIVLTDGAGKGTGAIGTAAAPIKIETSLISASTLANVFLLNNGTANVNITASTLPAGKTFALINATGGIDTVPGGGLITAGTVVLVSSAGKSIGDSASPALVNAPILTISAGKSAFISDPTTSNISLAPTSINGVTYNNQATDTYQVVGSSAPILNNNQPIKAGDIYLQAITVATMGNITGTKSIILGALGAGNLQIDNVITAPDILLGIDTGTAVQGATPNQAIVASNHLSIQINANGTANLANTANNIDTLSTNVGGAGQVLLTAGKPLKIATITGAAQIVRIKYTGSVTTTQPFAIAELVLTPSGVSKNDSVTIGGAVTATTLATIKADGGGTMALAGLSSTGNVDLSTDTGKMTLNGALQGQQVTMTTKGGDIAQVAAAPITAAGALIINLTGAADVSLNKADNNFSVLNDTVTGNATLALKTIGTITLNSIVGTSQTLSVSSGDTVVTPSVIEAKSLTINAAGAGGIGNIANPVTTAAAILNLFDPAVGANVFAKSTNATGVTLTGLTGTNSVTLTATGPIAITGAVKGQSISVQSALALTITTPGAVGDATTNTLTLTSTGAGDINNNSTNKVTGKTISVASAGGSIGGKLATQLFETAGSNIDINTKGAGVVNVINTTTGPVTLGTSTSGQAFTFNSTGPLTIGSIGTAGDVKSNTGNLTVINKTGTLTVSDASVIAANGGNIILQNNDVKAGFITIGNGSSIKASSTMTGVGNVTINIGPAANKVVGQVPTNVMPTETLGGKIYYGKNGITAQAPTNTLNALGRNIIFDTDNTSVTIQLGGSVTIQADPPEGMTNTPSPAITILQTSGQQLPQLIAAMPVANSVIDIPKMTNTAPPAMTIQSLVAGINSGNNISLGRNIDQSFKQSLQQNFLPTAIDFSGAGRSVLNGGSRLIMAERDVVLPTPFGTVKVAAGATVLVASDTFGVSVYNFDDSKGNSVVVEVNGESIALSPASHVTITNCTTASFAELAPSERIGHRNLRRNQLKDGSVAFHTQFHLASALSNIDSVKLLLNSHESKDKTRARHLLKTAAIMMQLQSGGERFVSYRRPQMLSMAN